MGFPIFYNGKILFRNGKPAFSTRCCCGEEDTSCFGCAQDWEQTLVFLIEGFAAGECLECTNWPLSADSGVTINLTDTELCIWYAEGSWPCGGIWELSVQVFGGAGPGQCRVEAELYIWGQAMQPEEYIYWESDPFERGSPPNPVPLAYNASRSTPSTCDFTGTSVTIQIDTPGGP